MFDIQLCGYPITDYADLITDCTDFYKLAYGVTASR